MAAVTALAVMVSMAGTLQAQTGAGIPGAVPDRLPDRIDSLRMVPLTGHHPEWATAPNSLSAMPANQTVSGLTLVLARSAEQESAFEQLLAAQQDPHSPEYHRWLTAAQVGERFGLSAHDFACVSAWLQAQGLHITYVAPSRIFIGFSGTATQIGSAFHTALRLYKVHGAERMSVDSDPMLPASLAPVVKSIRGLYDIGEHPYHGAKSMRMASPELTASNGAHFLTPADFATIYNLPANGGGSGETIGIVGESRTDSYDFDEFQIRSGASLSYPVEIVPTAFGGVDPGPAYTAPPASDVSIDGQLEATLDVMRAGSVAALAQIDLVVATPASGGIADDAQYLVQTTPLPAQIMSISFGACESEAGPSGVAFWDMLFQQAASQGMSVFVSSGDAGASGCDTNFATPPASPAPNSPNYICSSSYATCVGGTEFNDTGDPSDYWSTSNSNLLESALGYIPEGAWNEPLNGDSEPQAASSGGGVSSIIPTPSWQTGTGVPSARKGRYTPDVSFSASSHDGYFGCFAAAGASCVPNSQGEFEFESFFGTSAAAPAMAGIAAILDENAGEATGNLNPQLYALAASAPTVFHDVTVATSGVSNCTVVTPSMCDNSIPGPAGLSGGQAGYLIGDGYDEVTGLGSLDIANFLASYLAPKTTPTAELYTDSSSLTTAQPLYVTVTVTGRTGHVPTGSVLLTGGGYQSASTVLINGSAGINIPADTLAVGNDVLKVSYTPDAASAPLYYEAAGSESITVTSVPIITPQFGVMPGAQNITIAEALPVQVYISGGPNNAVPTGTAVLTSGSYTSKSFSVGSNGISGFTIPAQALPVGTDTITAAYTPDATSAKIYSKVTASTTETVVASAPIAPTVSVLPNSSTITTAQDLSVVVYAQVTLGFYYQNPTGTITLTGGKFTSAPVALSKTTASFTIPAGSLAVGNDSLTATYTPDTGSAAIYSSTTGTGSITVTAAPPPSFTVSGTAVTVTPGATTGNTSTVTVTPAGGFTGSVTLTASVTSSPAGAAYPPTLSFGSTGSLAITGTGAGTATLAVTTTDGTVCGVPDNRTAAANSAHWFAGGGVALAGVLMLGFPAFRRKRLFPALLLLTAAASAITACGGGGSGKGTCQVATPGTTAGAYTVTVTGVSGSTKSTGTVTLTVQ